MSESHSVLSGVHFLLVYTYVAIPPCSYRWLGMGLWWLQCWHSEVAAVLCSAVYMSTQIGLFKSVVMLPCSYWWLAAELRQLQCWRTGIAAVLRCATSVSTQAALHISQVALYISCYITMVILMDWRGTVAAPVLKHWSCCSLALCHQCQYACCFIRMLPCYHGHIDGLAWNCGSSSADALELLQSCAVPSVSVHKLLYTYRKLLYTYVAILPWSYWWIGATLW